MPRPRLGEEVRRTRDRTKRRFLDEWVNAVNIHGGFGRWTWDVSRAPGDIREFLHDLQSLKYNSLFIIDLIRISLLQFPH